MPAPANNNFANASNLSGASGTLAGQTNVGATSETGEYTPSYAGPESVWYKYTPAVNGDFSVYTDTPTPTTGQLGDSVLTAFLTNFDVSNVIAEDDDSGAGAYSLLTITGVAGTTYYFQVTGYSGQVGTFDITWGDPPPTPGAPLVVTGIADNAFDLHGTINPQGLFTTWRFEYGLTAGYGSLTPDHYGDFTYIDYTAHAIVETINPVYLGLTSYTTYHFRLRAINASGTTVGSDATFTTGNLERPDVRNVSVGAITATTVVINFEINPMGLSTSYWGRAGSIDAIHTLDGSGSSWISVSSTVTGLLPNTKYFANGYAQNVNGTTYGYSFSFFTAMPVTFGDCPILIDSFTGTECVRPTSVGLFSDPPSLGETYISDRNGGPYIFSNHVGIFDRGAGYSLFESYPSSVTIYRLDNLAADAWATLTVANSKQDVGWMRGSLGSWINGYIGRSNNDLNIVQIIRWSGGVETVIATASGALNSGDRLGLRWSASSGDLSLWASSGAGAFSQRLAVNDTTIVLTGAETYVPVLGQGITAPTGPPAIPVGNLFGLSAYGVTPSPAGHGPFACPAGQPKYVWIVYQWTGPIWGITNGNCGSTLQCPVWWLELKVRPEAQYDCGNDAWTIGADTSNSVFEWGDYGTGYAAAPFYPKSPDGNAGMDDLDARFGGFYVFDSDFAYKCCAAIQSSLDSVQAAFASQGAYIGTCTDGLGHTSRGCFMPVKKSTGRLDDLYASYERCIPPIIYGPISVYDLTPWR